MIAANDLSPLSRLPDTMRAFRVREWGDLSNVSLDDAPRPAPGPGEVLVHLAHAGVNFMDVYTVRGTYKASKTYPIHLPLTLGVEGAGHVAGFGEGVAGLRVGDAVSYCLNWGSYADFAVVPATKLARIPDGIDTAVAAAVTFQGVTAHYLAQDMATLRGGDWALVWSGAGGIAKLLIQMLRRRGVRVAATASSAEKAEAARKSGAELVFAPEEDVAGRLRDASAGGAAIVYDSTGKATIDISMQCLRRRGTLVLVGTNSGPVPTLDVAKLMEAGSISFVRPRLADYIPTPEAFRARMDEVFGAVLRGELDASPAETFSLKDAKTPLQRLVDRTSLGKAVLKI